MIRMHLRSTVCLILLTAGMLRSVTAGEQKSKRLPIGTWGGQGIRLETSDSGATVEYDCAHGSIDQPISIDEAGRFDVKGLHSREHGGPVREGEQAKGEPVRYVGQTDGDTLTLTVRLVNRDETIGTFTLVRGKPGRIRRCL
jgi:hypothetical protein